LKLDIEDKQFQLLFLFVTINIFIKGFASSFLFVFCEKIGFVHKKNNKK